MSGFYSVVCTLLFTVLMSIFSYDVTGQNFIIDHSGHMGTTLSPKELREVRLQETNTVIKDTAPVQLRYDTFDDNNDYTSSEDTDKKYGQDLKPVVSLDYQNAAKELDSGEIEETLLSGRTGLRDKCKNEGGYCSGFKGCNTDVNIYKGYCTSDYSEVCCVPRETICEVNDGICTDDAEACVAAGEIMGRKYNFKFYTWMDCNLTHVCCRPSKRNNLFSKMTKEAMQTNVISEPVQSDEPERSSLRQEQRNRKLHESDRELSQERERSSRLSRSKLAKGNGFRAPPGFPKKDFVSPVFEDVPSDDDKKKPRETRRKQSRSRSSKKKSRTSRRPSSKRRQGSSNRSRNTLRSLPAALPPVIPAPLPVMSPYASLLYGLTGNTQQQQQPQPQPQQQRTANYVPPVQQGINDYLADYQGLSDLTAAYNNLRNSMLPQSVAKPQTGGTLRGQQSAANPTSLFGNIYL